MRKILMSFMLVLFSHAAIANDSLKFRRHPYSAAEYVRNYAIVVCFSRAYPESKALEEDLTLAARAYIELGSLSIDAYNETYALAGKFLAREYPAEHGEKLSAIKCIDFYHSKELQQVIAKYQKIMNLKK